MSIISLPYLIDEGQVLFFFFLIDLANATRKLFAEMKLAAQHLIRKMNVPVTTYGTVVTRKINKYICPVALYMLLDI